MKYPLLLEIRADYFFSLAKHVENFFPLRFNTTAMASFSSSALAHPPAIVNIDSTTPRGEGKGTRQEEIRFPIISFDPLNIMFVSNLCFTLTNV